MMGRKSSGLCVATGTRLCTRVHVAAALVIDFIAISVAGQDTGGDGETEKDRGRQRQTDRQTERETETERDSILV